jgi:hypothetical protein
VSGRVDVILGFIISKIAPILRVNIDVRDGKGQDGIVGWIIRY